MGYVRQPKLLWSGKWFMHEDQVCELAEPVSAQPHGIIVHWQLYQDGAAKGQNHTYFFVPKSHVARFPGDGCDFSSISNSSAFWKYLYISDTTIRGNSINDDSSRTVAGISLSNNKFVLTEVLGV